MHACLHYYSDYKLSLRFLFSVYIGLGAWGLGKDITQYMGGVICNICIWRRMTGQRLGWRERGGGFQSLVGRLTNASSLLVQFSTIKKITKQLKLLRKIMSDSFKKKFWKWVLILKSWKKYSQIPKSWLSVTTSPLACLYLIFPGVHQKSMVLVCLQRVRNDNRKYWIDLLYHDTFRDIHEYYHQKAS